jgi:hypothetical protein
MLAEAVGQRKTDNTIAKKGEKDKQWSTKHYTENKRSNNTNPINIWGWTPELRKG